MKGNDNILDRCKIINLVRGVSKFHGVRKRNTCFNRWVSLSLLSFLPFSIMCRCSGKSFILRFSPGRWYLRRSHCNMHVLFVAKTAGIRTFVITNKLTPAHVRESKARNLLCLRKYTCPHFLHFHFYNNSRDTRNQKCREKAFLFISLVSLQTYLDFEVTRITYPYLL